MFDILIVGAGPAGLSLAKLLSGQNRKIGVLERQPLVAIENPAFDGREIALTQHSMALLTEMGVVPHFQHDEHAALNAATVLNDNSTYSLDFTPPVTSDSGLGFMVSNHAIRRGLYEEVKNLEDVELITNEGLQDVDRHPQHLTIMTTKEKQLTCRLLVAADSRFSVTRRQMGIGASMTDYGRTMLVCRMSHEQPHEGTAYEIFDIGQTLALLPLAGNCSSVVVTLPTPEIETLLALDTAAFTAEMEQRLKFRFGSMQLVSKRFAYPLVAAYANHFINKRFALIGDAAVGMHPVTAHGFNLGLYADDRMPARVARAAGLRVADLLKPIKRKVVSRLMSG